MTFDETPSGARSRSPIFNDRGRNNHSPCFGHILCGRCTDTRNSAELNTMRMGYTAYPPIQLCSSDVAKRDVEAPGPIARVLAPMTCATPFTAPRQRLSGAEDETKMKIAPMRDSDPFSNRYAGFNGCTHRRRGP